MLLLAALLRFERLGFPGFIGGGGWDVIVGISVHGVSRRHRLWCLGVLLDLRDDRVHGGGGGDTKAWGAASGDTGCGETTRAGGSVTKHLESKYWLLIIATTIFRLCYQNR